MNNGIKKKLEELIGDIVGVSDHNGVIVLNYPPKETNVKKKVLRFEGNDCIVIEDGEYEMFLPIDYISSVNIKK